MSIESICLTLRGLFVRCISNLPSATDKKLCFTLCQLKLCRKSNDKPVYSEFLIVSLVDFDINISVALSIVINIFICIVYLTILTIYNCLNARRFHLLWLRMWFFLLQCCMFINSSSYTPINWWTKLYNSGYCCSDKRRLDVEVLEQVRPDPQSKGVC
jgi:hypothetical protein